MRRNLPIWIALVAIVFHALWPLAANALPKPAAPPSGHEICTAFGMSVVPDADSNTAPESDRTAKAKSHCTFCYFSVADDPVVALPCIRIDGLVRKKAPAFGAPVPVTTAPSFSPANPRGPPN
jgi:Protein of unknown function (DUF2946)